MNRQCLSTPHSHLLANLAVSSPRKRSQFQCWAPAIRLSQSIVLGVHGLQLEQHVRTHLRSLAYSIDWGRLGCVAGNNSNASDSMPAEYWEIKMGISELRNGKWTAK